MYNKQILEADSGSYNFLFTDQKQHVKENLRFIIDMPNHLAGSDPHPQTTPDKYTPKQTTY